MTSACRRTSSTPAPASRPRACWSSSTAATCSWSRARTDGDGRAEIADELDPGTYRLVFHPPSPFFKRVELEVQLDDGPLPRPPPRLALLVRELPRQLSVEELAPLFSGRTRLVDELAEREDPLAVAEEVALALAEDDQVAALATHPRIGEPSEEQRGAEPEVLAELARLNEEYEQRFGFSFVVFVNGRTRAELLPVLRERLARTRDEELETGLRALCEIAREHGGRGLSERARRPRPAAAARRRRDRVDRGVVLLHPARSRPAAARGRSRRGARSRGRVLGRARRRLLPLAEVQGRPAGPAGASALVQVGGVHDVALRLRAARRSLLARRGHAARRPGRRRSEHVAGRRDLGRRARARVARVRRRLPRPPGRPRGGGRGRGARHALGVRRRRALRGARGLPPGGRDARDDHGGERLLRDHPGALGARPRQAAGPRARPGARPAREAALGAQQLPDAAGRLHDARRALPARLRERPRLARPARDLRARRRDPALLQPLARRQAPLVDPGGGHGRSGRAGDRARAGGRRRTTTAVPTDAQREHRRGALRDVSHRRVCAAGRAPRERRADQEARECSASSRRSARTRCRPATPPG